MVLTIPPSVGWSQQNLPQVGQKPAPAVGAPAIGFELKTLEGKSIGLDTLPRQALDDELLRQLVRSLPRGDAARQYAGIQSKQGRVHRARDRRRRYSRRRNGIRQRGQVSFFPLPLDLNSTVKRAYRKFGPPATFFIDAQGVIRDIVVGPITAGTRYGGTQESRRASSRVTPVKFYPND